MIKTAGRWPWKSEPAKECVTTHLPNQLALKMDGAEANDLNLTTRVNYLKSNANNHSSYCEALVSRRA